MKQNLIIAALLLIILFFWFDRNNNKREIKKADKVFTDSIANLKDIITLTEIEISHHKDTVSHLKKELAILQSNTQKSRTVKIKAFSEPKIVVSDSIPQIVKDRIAQDSVKIESLLAYGADLDNENRSLTKLVRSQDHQIKALESMNETKDLMVAQLNARHENDKELFKNERKLKRKWIVVSGVLVGLLVLSL